MEVGNLLPPSGKKIATFRRNFTLWGRIDGWFAHMLFSLMGPPPFPRADVFVPLSPHASFRSLGFLLSLPVWNHIKSTSEISPVHLSQTSIDHLKVNVFSVKEDHT